MLETLLSGRFCYILLGILVIAGVVSKGVVSISLKKLTKAAGNMSKSSHGLMKLVRAKYEHACMVSDKVQNVAVFVEKYLYEYKIWGVRLHGWRRLERISAWGCLCTGVLFAGMEYMTRGMSDHVLRNGVLGSTLGILLFLLRISMDESYYLTVIRTYMVDYLDNVCARRYEKKNLIRQDESREEAEQEPEKVDEKEAEEEHEEEKIQAIRQKPEEIKEDVPEEPIGEVRIRQILEEFLA